MTKTSSSWTYNSYRLTSTEVTRRLKLEYPDLLVKGFRPWLKALLEEHAENDEDREEIGEIIEHIAIIPDAFRVDRGAEIVEIYEVEVANWMSLGKLESYFFLETDLNAFGWDCNLISVNRRGEKCLVDPGACHVQGIKDAAHAPGA